MKVIFSAGGTLGHIYPAISLMNKYISKYPHDDIYFVVNEKSKSFFDIIQIPSSVKILYFEAYGMSKSIIKLVKAYIYNLKTYKQIRRLIRNEKVDVVVGMGGFISGITIKAGKKEKAYTIIHEQNSIMGLANKLSLKYTDLLLTTFPMKQMKKSQYEVGNPRYFDAIKYSNSILKSKYNILILSGSLGAKAINDIATQFLEKEESKKFTITLITGKRYYDEVVNKIKPEYHFQILPFSNKVLELISNSGIVISRAGSSTIFEILGAKSIPILIPSPNVTNNHQFYNATSIVNKGLGYMIEEKDLTLESFVSLINNVVKNYEKIKTNIDKYAEYNQVTDIIKYIDSNKGEK